MLRDFLMCLSILWRPSIIGLVILYGILTIMPSEAAGSLNNRIDFARVLAYFRTVAKNF